MPETSDHAQAKAGRGPLLALLIPLAALLLTALPCIAFIWRALGRVQAQYAFFPELMDYARLASIPSLVATVLVVPIAVPVWIRRAPAGRWRLALGDLSVLVYGLSNFIAFAYYSLRIT